MIGMILIDWNWRQVYQEGVETEKFATFKDLLNEKP